ncbi:MAG: efflux RND transporter periplasmic adaptor subunit [Verrucomicrobiales bacterium]|nr:efflux RND transporter periplasmic adaptor subunit [Verrucomicrobiales bacterium]
MSNPNPTTEPVAFDALLAELRRLRRFSGPPTEFWPTLVQALSQVAGANRGMVLRRDPRAPEKLLKIAEWVPEGHADRAVQSYLRCLPDLTDLCLREGRGLLPLENPVAGTRHFAFGVTLHFLEESQHCVAAFLGLATTEADVVQRLLRLELAADVPLAYQSNQAASQARRDVQKFASVLDVVVPVNAETRFLAANLAFCNALAGAFECERVSLGWLQGGFVRLKSISRTERFDKQMVAVQALEKVMEESLDQDDEILAPPPEGATFVSREHQTFLQANHTGHLVTVPLRVGGKAVAALTCERKARAFDTLEVQQLRLACDTVARRLDDLHRTDRWFGSRWFHAMKERAGKWVGPQHTWAKVAAVAGAVALVALLLPIYPYRVEGNFILRSDEVTYLTAPFDGYIRSVEVRPGDTVTNGGTLLALNTDQLVLDEAGAVADQTRFRREAEKARANNAPADMRIAQALADQAATRLEVARYRLRQARLNSPFEGVVVEGDLRQRIGAPVRQGDALFKLARLDALYVEAEVNERDVHEILDKSVGEIAFLAQPKRKHPVRVVRIEPAAVPKEKENVFLVRCALEQQREDWWRPGMSGVVKVDVERRTLLWILTHRTVDFLRLFLWW